MYKQKLEEIIIDRLFEGKITEKQYNKLIEKINKIDETTAELLIEVTHSGTVNRKSYFSAGTGMGMAGNFYGGGLAAAGAASGAGAAGAITGLFAYPIYRAIRGKFDKCSKSCGTYAFNTPKRQICMAKCKVILLQNMYNEAKKLKNLSPVKLSKLEQKLNKAKIKYDKMVKFAKETGRNPNPKVIPGAKSRFSIPG